MAEFIKWSHFQCMIIFQCLYYSSIVITYFIDAVGGFQKVRYFLWLFLKKTWIGQINLKKDVPNRPQIKSPYFHLKQETYSSIVTNLFCHFCGDHLNSRLEYIWSFRCEGLIIMFSFSVRNYSKQTNIHTFTFIVL